MVRTGSVNGSGPSEAGAVAHPAATRRKLTKGAERGSHLVLARIFYRNTILSTSAACAADDELAANQYRQGAKRHSEM